MARSHVHAIQNGHQSESKRLDNRLTSKLNISVFKIDSGAQANIIPKNCFRTLKNEPKLHKPNAKLTAYNGSSIPVKGSCILITELNWETIPVLFIVIDVNSQNVLGLKASTQLNLVKWIMSIDKTPDPKVPSYLNKFKDCFRGIGWLRREHHIV